MFWYTYWNNMPYSLFKAQTWIKAYADTPFWQHNGKKEKQPALTLNKSDKTETKP